MLGRARNNGKKDKEAIVNPTADVESAPETDTPAGTSENDGQLPQMDEIIAQGNKILRIVKLVCVAILLLFTSVFSYVYTGDVECAGHVNVATRHVQDEMADMPSLPSGSDDWVTPPHTTSGEPFWVDMRMDLVKVSQVDTTQLTVYAQFYVAQYWTDPRLVGWTGALPDKLWGPKMVSQR